MRDSVGDPVTSDNARQPGLIDLPTSHELFVGLQRGSAALGPDRGPASRWFAVVGVRELTRDTSVSIDEWLNKARSHRAQSHGIGMADLCLQLEFRPDRLLH